MNSRILLLDVEASVFQAIQPQLLNLGLTCESMNQINQVQSEISRDSTISVLLMDVKKLGKKTFEFVDQFKKKSPFLKVILIADSHERDLAIGAFRHGISDYFEKPISITTLLKSIEDCERSFQSLKDQQNQVAVLEDRIHRTEGRAEDQLWYVSKDDSMKTVNDWLLALRKEALRGDKEERFVLIEGETGTGKEGIARMIHSGSRRARGPWVTFSCANYASPLFETELFGSEDKRGLLELAKGGTLYLDHFGELDSVCQNKLLGVLQDRKFYRVGSQKEISFDVRIIAADSGKVQNLTREGKFRGDLYQLVAQVIIQVPPLRERTQDVIPMAVQFAEKSFQLRGKKFEGFSSDAEEALNRFSWPGNVRELWNVIERLALLWDESGQIPVEALSIPSVPKNLPGAQLHLVPSLDSAEGSDEGYTTLKKQWSDSFEKQYLMSTLNRNGGNVSAAAREAKLDRSNFLRLLRRHGLKAQEYRKAA